MQKDLEILKKNYGEKFAHLCRTLFPTLLEKDGLLSEVIMSKFAPSKALINDLYFPIYHELFKNYIYSLVDVEQEEPDLVSSETPAEILDKAGYTLYQCETEEDVQKFKRYYAKSEELCTFNGGRCNWRHVFWIVKKDADKIERKNFTSPKREDEYSTSVLSIQFDIGERNRVEIISRYNHTVNNPNSTYGNDLEAIAPGLTKAFESTYGFKVSNAASVAMPLTGYVMANDGKYYKYNVERNGFYYCENNIIIHPDGQVVHLDPSKEILFDCYVLSKVKGKIDIYNYDYNLSQSFVSSFGLLPHVNTNGEDSNIVKADIINERDEQGNKTGNKIINLTTKKGNVIIIKLDELNRMIEYTNQEVETIGNYFVTDSPYIKKVSLANLKTINSFNFNNCRNLTEVNCPSLEEIGQHCFNSCNKLNSVNIPKLQKTERGCFNNCLSLTTLDLPELTATGEACICNCKYLEKVNLPKLTNVQKLSISNLPSVTYLNLPSATQLAGGNFINCEKLVTLDLPKVVTVGDTCIKNNNSLITINMPLAEKFGKECITSCKCLKTINLPSAKEFEKNCITDCYDSLEYLELPNAERFGIACIYNCSLKKISLPKAKFLGGNCINGCDYLTELSLPMLTFATENSIRDCANLQKVDAPKLSILPRNCLWNTPHLRYVNMPNLEQAYFDSTYDCSKVKYFYAPKLAINSTMSEQFIRLIQNSLTLHDAQTALSTTTSKKTTKK